VDIVVRQETVADRPAVDEVVRLAFGRELEMTLTRALRAWNGYDPSLSLVAELDGRVVGHVSFTGITIEDDSATHGALCMAPVSVHPDVQNRAIGSRLVRAGLDVCRARGHRIVIVQGHPSYYPRFGFVPARPLGIEPPSPLPDPVWMVQELVAGALEDVRGTVRYPPPWDVLEPE
jgi:putative acetyltransferase